MLSLEGLRVAEGGFGVNPVDDNRGAVAAHDSDGYAEQSVGSLAVPLLSEVGLVFERDSPHLHPRRGARNAVILLDAVRRRIKVTSRPHPEAQFEEGLVHFARGCFQLVDLRATVLICIDALR